MTLKKIEEIESYYLSVITKYIGADINGLVQKLENHNLTWNDWFSKSSKRKSYFDTGSERVVYMLLNRGDILGEPNANPVGSDNSFFKYDYHFGQYLSLNIDVKSTRANTNLDDIIGSIPIGINQNSYESDILYDNSDGNVEKRHYEPGLPVEYIVKDQHNVDRTHLTLSFEIVILYEQLPIDDIPTEERVIGIFVNCVPNGKLHDHYKDRVFVAGKTSDLKLKKGQRVYYNGRKYFVSKGDETIKSILAAYNITRPEYIKRNGHKSLSWDLDGRFNYMKVQNFELLDDNPNRINKLFLKNDRLDYYFYWVNKNKILPKKRNRKIETVDPFNFLINLPTL